ncbi:copper amine oxidase N-terminal domain-containing protein [Paenibacillus daejeonensis]|uniref:copper amine oxidase N-terminal domain-containing protein n=1 Tax=Paenibacillus daejeonensis TaxID=135193 RepID=UPI00035E0B40|nr:copper amine oxidase N-terminal domain-containing protein [Paenibacillus daejeonensis]
MASQVSALSNMSAGTQISLTLNGEAYQTETAPFVYQGTTYFPVREMGELLGTVVFWHASSNFVTMTYPKLTVRLTNGAVEATVNGQPVSLTAPLKTVDGKMYAPLRFFSEVVGAEVVWNSVSKTVHIQKTNDFIQFTGNNETIWLHSQLGELYIARSYEQSPVHAGKIDMDFKGELSFESGGIRPTPSVITFVDNHGSAGEYYDTYSVLVHNKKIIKQNNASYYKRYEPNLSSYQYYDPDGWIQRAVLTDGKIVTVYDTEGTEIKSYDLPALVGKDEVYSVQGVMEDFLIVRPNQSGFLTYVDLNDDSVVELYKHLLTGRDLDYFSNRQDPYAGDDLRYIGYDSWMDTNPLIFFYKSPFAPEYIDYNRVLYDRHK